MDTNLEGFIGFLEEHGLVEFDVDGDGETHFTNRLKLQKYVFLAKQLRKMVQGWVGKRLTYKQLVAHSTLCGQP